MIKKMVQVIVLLISVMLCAATASAGDKVVTLEEACSAALSANENMKMMEEGVAQSDSRVDQAWTYVYPRVVAQSAYTKYNDTLPPGGGPFLFQPDQQFTAALI